MKTLSMLLLIATAAVSTSFAAPKEVSLWILAIDQENKLVIANPTYQKAIQSSVQFAKPTMVAARDKEKTIIITGIDAKSLELVDDQHLYLMLDEDGTGQWSDTAGGTHTVRQYNYVKISRESDRGPKP